MLQLDDTDRHWKWSSTIIYSCVFLLHLVFRTFRSVSDRYFILSMYTRQAYNPQIFLYFEIGRHNFQLHRVHTRYLLFSWYKKERPKILEGSSFFKRLMTEEFVWGQRYWTMWSLITMTIDVYIVFVLSFFIYFLRVMRLYGSLHYL